MTPDELLESLKKQTRSGLRSVILYGSAVAGDYAEKGSDYNVLVLTERLGVSELNALMDVASRWTRAGNPPFLLFTEDRLKRSADVFPIEILDIKESHRVLFGSDPISNLDVSLQNFRLQLEHELKGKLIQLRERYLLTGRKPARICDLMVESVSSFLVLGRAALRLLQGEVPQQKLSAIRELSRCLDLDVSAFEEIGKLKDGSLKCRSVNAEQLFSRYLKTIEELVDRVDSHINSE